MPVDNIIDLADFTYQSLGLPSDISLPYVSYYYRNALGYINSLTGSDLSITTTTPFNFNSDLSEIQKMIFHEIFLVHYYDKKINEGMGASAFSATLEVGSDGATVRMVNKNEIFKSYIALKDQHSKMLDKLVNGYKQGASSSSALAIYGDDYLTEYQDPDKVYTRLADRSTI